MDVHHHHSLLVTVDRESQKTAKFFLALSTVCRLPMDEDRNDVSGIDLQLSAHTNTTEARSIGPLLLEAMEDYHEEGFSSTPYHLVQTPPYPPHHGLFSAYSVFPKQPHSDMHTIDPI